MRVVSVLALVAAGLCAWPAAAADGAGLYRDNCAACHRPTGLGIPGAFPALAGNKVVQGDPREPISRVLQGRGGMPSFQDELTDLQIATILNYVRVSWGNKARPINPTQVTTLRAGRRDKPKPALQAH